LDAMELHLADTKTGARTVSLSPEAAQVLAGIPRSESNPWVVRGRRKGERMKRIDRPWCLVRERAGLEDVRIHDCRHSFASRALALGESLPAIGKLLGHAHVQTTARYAHLARDTTHEAAARVAESIAGDIL
ncbi:MAG: site-specific integrase, partial [Rhodospirillaceae bacterium]|nr:site-specific integrase [Rhodospirillaceae bacterium]